MAILSQAPTLADEGEDLWSRETLTQGLWGLDDILADSGITMGRSVTQIRQQNVRGGLSTHRRAGRYTGSYDLELLADLHQLLDIRGGILYVHTEGSWGSGLNQSSVGSWIGINGDRYGYETVVVTEFYYEQDLFDGALDLRVGKLDPTGGFQCDGCAISFDTNRYANDETRQFLNFGLINNPTIPFSEEDRTPSYALGFIAHYHPDDWWYATVGMVDAEGRFTETGFRTTFSGEDAFLYLVEGGLNSEFLSPRGLLYGTYRMGLWVNTNDDERFSDNREIHQDVGFYTSCDQLLYKENAAPSDRQGLGGFFRYGHAPSDRNELNDFWSIGFQYQGLLEGRDNDVLGLGMAQGIFTDQPNANDGKGYTDHHETGWELYYNAKLTPWLELTPSIQYIQNPGGDRSRSDAVVLGFRTQMVF